MKKFAGDITLHMCTKNQHHVMYGSWDVEQQTDSTFCHFGPFFVLLFFVILGHFFSPEILSFYKYMCTINEDRMICGSWNIRCHRHKFLSFWVIFYYVSPLTTRKIKILKLKKTPVDIIIFHICTIDDNHLLYGSWDKFCHFGPFFALLHP